MASSPTPDPTPTYARDPDTPSYIRDQIIVRFREAPSRADVEGFERRHSLTLVSYAGLGKPRGLGWYLFRIDDGTDAAVVRELLRSDPMVCYSTLNRLGAWAAVGLPEPDEEIPCDPLPSPLPEGSPGPVSPAPDGAPGYVRDEILVWLREAPSETDLEIFTGRQFLTLVSSPPSGLGWYRFRIDDGMDAKIVRNLLWNDPMVCDAILIQLGTWDAIGPAESGGDPCNNIPVPSALPERPTQGEAAAGGGGPWAAPSEPGPAREGVPAAWDSALLLLSAVIVAGLGASFWLRPKTRP